jgi:hypothetical protein
MKPDRAKQKHGMNDRYLGITRKFEHHTIHFLRFCVDLFPLHGNDVVERSYVGKLALQVDSMAVKVRALSGRHRPNADQASSYFLVDQRGPTIRQATWRLKLQPGHRFSAGK